MGKRFTSWRDNPYFKKLGPETKEHGGLVEWIRWVKFTENWFHYPAEGKKSSFEQYLWAIMGGTKNVPDFMFFDHHQGYCGLALELKNADRVIYNKDGSLRADMKDQFEFLERLKKCGWRTELVAGKEPARKIIADYYGIKL